MGFGNTQGFYEETPVGVCDMDLDHDARAGNDNDLASSNPTYTVSVT